jgi:hypothetical protein
MNSASFVERHADRETPPDWSEAMPAGIRSEAFAEDLTPTLASRVDAVPATTTGGTRFARARRRLPRWAAVLALIGRRPAAAS